MKTFANFKESLRHMNSVFDIDSRNKKSAVKTKIIFAILSLLASAFLWAFVAWDGTSEITRTVEVPLEYTNRVQGVDIFQHTDTVSVKLAGNMAALSRLNKAQLSAKVVLAGIAPGKYDLPVMVDVPNGVRVVSWKPSLVEVEIYKKNEKLIPVSLKPIGEDDGETDMLTAEILPASALVAGPKEEIDSIRSLEARVPVKTLKDAETYTTELVAVDAQDKPITRIAINPKTVIVKPQKQEEGNLYPVKIKLSGQPLQGYEISSVRVTPQEIRIKGKKEALEHIHAIEFPEIDVSGLTGNLHKVLPIGLLELGEGIDVVGTDKVTVDITVKKGLANRTFSEIPIVVTGAKYGEKWGCTPAVATVVAEGTRAVIDSADAPCVLNVDVTSIVTSTITLPVIVKNVKRGIKIVNIEPEEVIVHRE